MQFSRTRRQTLEVKGFGGRGNHSQSTSTRLTAVATQHHRKEVLPSRPLIQEEGKAGGEVSHQSTTEELEGNGQGMLVANLESPRVVGNQIRGIHLWILRQL